LDLNKEDILPMVVIRLSRTGTKNSAFYHIVVTDSRNSRDSGRYIERLGYFNPNARGQDIPLLFEKERIEYWTSKGAQVSERVNTLMKEFAKGRLQPQTPATPKAVKAKKPAPAATAAEGTASSEE
jgi:small subunit ribosomal protein S16